MRSLMQRHLLTAVLGLAFVAIVLHFTAIGSYGDFRYHFKQHQVPEIKKPDISDSSFHWESLPYQYPLEKLAPLPAGHPRDIPRIQGTPAQEDSEARIVRLERLAAVKQTFNHSWTGYKQHAWKSDEVGPLSGDRHDFFGGWAASLVDALDTLWIMGMKAEFEEALEAVASIDFTTSTESDLNVFETTIRYLGGFLSAYDLSGGKYPILIQKAAELGEMLLHSFDTPNHMPVTRWQWAHAAAGGKQQAHSGALVAEVGSLTLEFTRLSQITRDMRFYDAVQRIMDEFDRQQMKTKLPGMWPITINARDMDFRSDTAYTLGAMSDSLYEYLPKQHLLLGGLSDQYQNMYTRAADTFTKHNFYRPMLPDSPDVLFSGLARADGTKDPVLDYSMQHLVCFTGGMVGMGAKIFSRADDLSIARRLVDGCIWAYDSLDNGLMAETSHHIPCESASLSDPPCEFDEARWRKAVEDDSGNIEAARLKPGYLNMPDRRYILRPEAIESVFMWYRISGDRKYLDHAWRMFQAIERHTRTDIAHAALDDVTADPPTKADRMESFWMAETLKYFYLIFEEVNVVSLDDYVFNTEAHPFLRPKK